MGAPLHTIDDHIAYTRLPNLLCIQFPKSLLVHDLHHGFTLANLRRWFRAAIEILADPLSVEVENRADNTEQSERANHGADNNGSYGAFMSARRFRGKELGKSSGSVAGGRFEFGGLALSSVGTRSQYSGQVRVHQRG